MNDLLKAVIGLIIIAILAGAFIAVRSRNSGQTINSVPTSPGVTPSPGTASPGTATSSQPARSVGFSTQQGGTGQGQTTGTTTTPSTSTTTSTGQSTGTPSASTTTPTVQPGVTPNNQNPTGAGTKPVPALW